MEKRKGKIIFEDKEGNVRLAIFKNKNNAGTTYTMCCLTLLRFPFKFNQKINFPPSEAERIIAVLKRLPEIKLKGKK